MVSQLFTRTGLEQDTGSIRDRWSQDDSSIIQASASVTSTASPATLFTVTSGKTAYIDTIIFNSNEGVGTVAGGHLDDDSTRIMSMFQDKANGSLIPPLRTPLKFTTSIKLVSNSNNDVAVSIVGWEE